MKPRHLHSASEESAGRSPAPQRGTPARYIAGAIAIFFTVAFALIGMTAWFLRHPHLK